MECSWQRWRYQSGERHHQRQLGPTYGGGLWRSGPPGTHTINNSTIYGNEHTTLAHGSNNLYLALQHHGHDISNSIVAGGINGTNCDPRRADAWPRRSYNLDDGTSCDFASTGDQSSATPNLGPLADNGGPTQTLALLAGSDALSM